MAPLPPESTARYYVDYSNSDRDHTFIARSNGAFSPSAFGTLLNTLFSDIDSLLYQVTINAVRFSAEGSTISLPVVTGIEGSTYGSGSAVSQGVPNYMRFQGRSVAGRRCSFDIYTINLSDANFRITSAEHTEIADAVGHLNAATGIFMGIDGEEVNWYPYVNVKASSYWTRAIRNGG